MPAPSLETRAHRGDDWHGVRHPGPIPLRVGRGDLTDRLDSLLHAAVEPHDRAVPVHRDRERVHLPVLQPDRIQPKLLDDAGGVDDVVRSRVRVEPVARHQLLSA